MEKASAIITIDSKNHTVFATEIHIQKPFKRFEVLRIDGFNTYSDIPTLLRSFIIHVKEVECIDIRMVEAATGDQYDISIIDIQKPYRIHQYII